MKVDDFSRAGNRIIAGAMNGMEEFAAIVMADSLIECPIDTGTLRRSASIIHTTTDGRTLDTIFGYGFGDEVNPKTIRLASEYAVPVHERLYVRHAPPTKAKFLEDPVLLHSSKLESTMARRIQESLRFENIMIEAAPNVLGSFPIITRYRGQPITRTRKGPRFARKRP